MDLSITKEQFESFVPAAQEPTGQVFDRLANAIFFTTAKMEQDVLGIPGVTAVEGEVQPLRKLVIQYVCMRAFQSELRSADLVLTATGFGVVSTNDVAPASKMRVDALDGQLRQQLLRVKGNILAQLFGVAGWAETAQRQIQVKTVFYHPDFLSEFAGIQPVKPEDWSAAQVPIIEADRLLREHMGDEQTDALLTALTTNSLNDLKLAVVWKMRQYFGLCIAKQPMAAFHAYEDIINIMERNASTFQPYMNSKAYQLNHFTPYENHAEDSAFHFVG